MLCLAHSLMTKGHIVLSNRIREIREQRGMSQRELGRLTGLSRQTLSAIERNDGYSPNGNVMVRLAEALGTPLQELFWSEPSAVAAS